MSANMYLMIDQLTQMTLTISIDLDDCTPLSYLVNGMFQKQLSLTMCCVCSVGWAEFKCVIHHVPLHSRHRGQFAGFYKHAIILQKWHP